MPNCTKDKTLLRTIVVEGYMWRSDAGYKSNMRNIVQCEVIKYMFNIIYLNKCTFDTDNPYSACILFMLSLNLEKITMCSCQIEIDDKKTLCRKLCKLIISNIVVHILRKHNYWHSRKLVVLKFPISNSQRPNVYKHAMCILTLQRKHIFIWINLN
jgi:hypothetical protein